MNPTSTSHRELTSNLDIGADQIHQDKNGSSTLHDSTSSVGDQGIGSNAWRKDPLIGLGGPMQRSRTKQIHETLNALIKEAQSKLELDTGAVNQPKYITLLKVK